MAIVVRCGHCQVCGDAFCHGGLGISRAHDMAHDQCGRLDWRLGLLALREVVVWMVDEKLRFKGSYYINLLYLGLTQELEFKVF